MRTIRVRLKNKKLSEIKDKLSEFKDIIESIDANFSCTTSVINNTLLITTNADEENILYAFLCAF